MPIPQSQVPSVEEICTDLGYNTKKKPKRQYDLTLSTKKWRESYFSSDGIPGRELTEWASDKGNADIKVMSQRFLECHGVRHWPPGSGGLEFREDEETLLELLHQLFWRQNLAAKNNQIHKEKREALKQGAQSLTPGKSSRNFIDDTGIGFTTINSQSGNQSPHNASVHSYPRGAKTHPSRLSRGRRRPSPGAYAELSTDSQEADNQSRPNSTFKRKFLLNLTQFQAVAKIWDEEAASVASKSTKTQERKSSLGKTYVETYPPHCAKEISDTRRKDVSGSARRSREEKGLNMMWGRSSGRTGTGAVTAAVEAEDETSSWTPQSPIGCDISASKSPIDSTVNDLSRGKNGEHAPTDGVQPRRRLSGHKRTLSKGSVEITMSAKRPRRRSTVRERIWPFTPTTSADFELNVSGKIASVPRSSSSRSTFEEPGGLDYAYPSPIDTQAETSAHGTGSDSGTLAQTGRADTYRLNEAPSKQDSTSVTPICHRCKQLRNNCNGRKPCNRCTPNGRGCVYSDPPSPKPRYASSHDTRSPEPSGFHKVHYFFFGTLQEPRTLSRILGRFVEPSSFRPASIIGYSRQLRGSHVALVDGPPGAIVEGMAYEVECEEDEIEILWSRDLTDNDETASCHIHLENGGKGLLPQTILGKTFKHEEIHSRLSTKETAIDTDDERAEPSADEQSRRTQNWTVGAGQSCQRARAGDHGPPETGNWEQPRGTLAQPAGKEQDPTPADQNISTRDQIYQDHGSNSPRRGASSQAIDIPVPKPVHSTNTTRATQHSPPKANPKPKSVTYYILASDSTSSFEKPWTGPSLSEMTMDTLFTQAAAHTSGEEVLKVKFTLSSSRLGFVGRQNVVDKDDAESLEEVKERFRMGRKEGLRNGFTKFNVLLEPYFGSQVVVYEFDDEDDL